MLKKSLVIKNKTGLHARPAAAFVELADKFAADIRLSYQGLTVNAKSIIGVLSLGLGPEEKFVLITDGPDEKEALIALENLVKNNFVAE